MLGVLMTATASSLGGSALNKLKAPEGAFFMERIYSTEIVNNEKIPLVIQHDSISNL